MNEHIDGTGGSNDASDCINVQFRTEIQGLMSGAINE
jgi:hypothetical protein